MNKLNLGLTRQEYPYFVIFIIASIITIGLAMHFKSRYDILEMNVTLIAYVISMVILGLFLLDEKNIIVFRARKDRLTKCSVCNRTYTSAQSILEGEDIEPHEQTIEEKTGDVEEKTILSKIKPEKAIPVNGIVVNGRLVCDKCLDVIKEIYKKWQ